MLGTSTSTRTQLHAPANSCLDLMVSGSRKIKGVIERMSDEKVGIVGEMKHDAMVFSASGKPTRRLAAWPVRLAVWASMDAHARQQILLSISHFSRSLSLPSFLLPSLHKFA